MTATNYLVMGPWSHGSWSNTEGDSLGNLHFNAKTAIHYREKMELPFFEYHLKSKGENKLSKASVFETGTNRWRQFDAWPPKEVLAKDLFLHADGKLKWSRPKEEKAIDEYVSDPAKPVPYLEKIAIGMTGDYMTADQRFASRRPDVLVYQTSELTEDVTVAGPIAADLTVNTTGTDADLIVKVIDVFPNDYPNPEPNPAGLKMGGYQMLVRAEVFRGKFRESFEKPIPFKPGEAARVRFTMPDACHTFRPGHRIMVQIQSSWFPIVDRNPQKFVDIYQAKTEDFEKATIGIFRDAERASKVTLQVIP